MNPFLCAIQQSIEYDCASMISFLCISCVSTLQGHGTFGTLDVPKPKGHPTERTMDGLVWLIGVGELRRFCDLFLCLTFIATQSDRAPSALLRVRVERVDDRSVIASTLAASDLELFELNVVHILFWN